MMRTLITIHTLIFYLAATVPHNGPSCVLSSHSSEGVISSHVLDVNGCGSARSPWSIEARAGQTVELSLLDFEALNRARHYSLSMCYQVYGFVVEKTLNINYTICGQQIRDSVIYRSNTNRIQLHLKEDANYNFLLKYKCM